MQLDRIVSLIDEKRQQQARVLIALAGPPAAGKSTISSALLEHYGKAAVILPMDGFHLDNKVLDAHGLRNRKGSPESFDADGFINMVKRIRSGEHVYAPEFDRAMDASIAGAVEIRDQPVVISEGNYLLFDEAPWRDLATIWDLAIWLETRLEIVEERCIERWLGYGFSEEQAREKALGNDVANAKRVIERRIRDLPNLIVID